MIVESGRSGRDVRNEARLQLSGRLAGCRLHLEHFVEAPAGDLAAGREPYAVGLLHVLDDAAQGLGPPGPARNVGMELERAIGRRDPRFLVKLVEHPLPDQQRILRISGIVDRKSTRLNSSHQIISYAVFCLKKKKKTTII